MGSLPYDNQEGWRRYFSEELEKLGSLVTYKGNYGPIPPVAKVVELAQLTVASIERAELPRPFVVPGADGSIQLKWRNSRRELSLFIGPESVEYLTTESHAAVSEGTLKGKYLNELLNWLMKAV